jgi:predicted metal-dependent HD superfamily phosphohydrolase
VSTNTSLHELHDRFLRALSEAGGQRAERGLFGELVTRYGEAHRHYHTLAHLDACLGLLDRFRGSAQHPERVELALWFHDAVYDPTASDNERQSALLARSRLAAVGLPQEALEDIEAHVLATQHHRGSLPDSELAIDLDLGILGASTPEFSYFERAIRKEYAHVPDREFALGRGALLQGLLTRPEIYRVGALREELEVRARANLERRMLELATAVANSDPWVRKNGLPEISGC